MARQRPRGSVTIIERIYHQAAGMQPVENECSYEIPIMSEEQQVFVRNFKIGDQWQALEGSWLEECSLMTVENRGIHPIQICFDGNYDPQIIVDAGRSCRFKPADMSNVYLRSEQDETRCLVHVYPS